MLPRLYAIADAAFFSESSALLAYVGELLSGGITLLQYRNKSGNVRRMLDDSIAVHSLCRGRATLILNDRADLCLAAGFQGVHLGQEDVSPEGARKVIGHERWIGISTHNPQQLAAADADAADASYLAIGPVFGTTSKFQPDPVVGLAGVRMARALTSKPLVAIGGITIENCRSVMDAGADSVAVISALLPQPNRPTAKSVEAFLRALG